jgi:hypothetical protein
VAAELTRERHPAKRRTMCHKELSGGSGGAWAWSPAAALRKGGAQATSGPSAGVDVQARGKCTRRRWSGGATGRGKTGAQGRQYTGRARARSRADEAECGRKAVPREKDKITRGWGDGGAAQLPAKEFKTRGFLQ